LPAPFHAAAELLDEAAQAINELRGSSLSRASALVTK